MWPHRDLHGAARVDRSPEAEPRVELPEPRAPGGLGGEAFVSQFPVREVPYSIGCERVDAERVVGRPLGGQGLVLADPDN